MIQVLPRPIDFPNLYPDSDGKPMADNTLQYRWIVRLVSNLKHLFRGQTVFVAGDLLWYPQQVTTPPAPSQAPDAMVVFGRSDGDRRSYKQWEEDNIAPQVVFEILSESNSASDGWQVKQKVLLSRGTRKGREIGAEVKLPGGFTDGLNDSEIPIFRGS